MNEQKIMNIEAFNEIIENFEIVGKLTEYGRKNIKYHVKRLQKENQQLKEHLERYEIIIFNLKEQLEKSEKARKEGIELINNINDWEICSKYDCMYKDDVLDVLRMLDIDKGE